MNLESFGWSAALAEHQSRHYPDMAAARICSQHRGAYELLTADGITQAHIDGTLRRAGEFPAVGDWIAYTSASADLAIIRGIYPRRTLLERKAAGTGTAAQSIAANIDWIFLMNGLDGDFNCRRIERYAAMAWESGARPVVLLNKADVCDDVAARLAELEPVSVGIPVHVLSLRSGDGLGQLDPYLQPGMTIALVGSSGTGKSTLVNILRGAQTQTTQDVRRHDDRGKHTTTARELFALPCGALVIDTPGMRELQLVNAHGGIGQAFEEIETLARQCFSDCSHSSEPDCAVREALETSLDPARLESYYKLQREANYLQRKSDHNAQAAEKARRKSVHKEARQYMKWRDH